MASSFPPKLWLQHCGQYEWGRGELDQKTDCNKYLSLWWDKSSGKFILDFHWILSRCHMPSATRQAPRLIGKMTHANKIDFDRNSFELTLTRGGHWCSLYLPPQARHPRPLFNQLWRECWWHRGTFRCVRGGFKVFQFVICKNLYLVSLCLVSRCKRCTRKFTGRETTQLHCHLNWSEPASKSDHSQCGVIFFIITIIITT